MKNFDQINIKKIEKFSLEQLKLYLDRAVLDPELSWEQKVTLIIEAFGVFDNSHPYRKQLTKYFFQLANNSIIERWIDAYSQASKGSGDVVNRTKIDSKKIKKIGKKYPRKYTK